jgi:ATP-binding cassette subfamily F protein uup
MSNLVNAERVTVTYGTRTLLDGISLGLGRDEAVGVVGRNGAGKTTLLRLLAGALVPDSGRVTHTGHLSIGFLHQVDEIGPDASVRDLIVGGEPDHVWAANPRTRSIVQHLLADVDLQAQVANLSGGERRRVALVTLLLADHDLLILDEPTNHLDVEAVDWLAKELRALQAADVAMLVVSHDRWFLDAICTSVWEVYDGTVNAYEGGYAAYVLTKTERVRLAAIAAARRNNLLSKELAWLRRVFDLDKVNVSLGGRTLLRDLSWSIGPGMRIGLIGVNGSGKTTLLRLLAGDLAPDSGRVKRGKTLRIGYLSQDMKEVRGTDRVLQSIDRVRRQTRLATGAEASASSLLEDFGFTGDRLTARLDDLSGGERRRLQILRMLLDEPNVLLLDEPTNDLDIDTLTVIEDYLDSWPGSLLVVTHDRYFLERVCDVCYALMGDGSCVLLPGGVEQYLQSRRDRPLERPRAKDSAVAQATTSAASRQARKDLARLEQQITRLDERLNALHAEMAAVATHYERLVELQRDIETLQASKNQLELAWLEAAEVAG